MKQHDRSEHVRWIRAAVGRYESGLLRYATQITGDVELARDVVQDTFLRLCWQSAEELDGRLAEWLFTVCRNRAIDVYRKERRMTTMTEGQAAQQISREPSQQLAAETHDSARRVESLLSELSENQQEVIRLKFHGGLSYRQISRITGLSVSNVGYLIHTAIQKVRRQLSLDCESPVPTENS